MALTRTEYDDLLRRNDAGEIVFYFDAAQCKDFFLHFNWKVFRAETGKSLRLQCSIIRTIIYGLEPLFLLITMISTFLWLKWWGWLIAPVVFLGWSFLKSMAAGGRQGLIKPIIVFVVGVAVMIGFRSEGLGFVIFMLSLSCLYLTEKMLYALPVLFFSLLNFSCYELVRLVYERSINDFSKQLGIPLMCYVTTVEGAPSKLLVQKPSRAYIALYGMSKALSRKGGCSVHNQ